MYYKISNLRYEVMYIDFKNIKNISGVIDNVSFINVYVYIEKAKTLYILSRSFKACGFSHTDSPALLL